uniref:glycine--tRNA ligase subunit beta n=1 Tax=Allorhizocola rhizosphaerae TaxID=1872709 RepID=UPI000E3D3D21
MRHTADRADRVATIALALATDEHAGPRGALVALADRLDSLTGLAVTVGLPSGRGDPFGLRRAALGAIAIHRDTPAFARLSLAHALSVAAACQPVEVGGGARYHIWDFLV